MYQNISYTLQYSFGWVSIYMNCQLLMLEPFPFMVQLIFWWLSNFPAVSIAHTMPGHTLRQDNFVSTVLKIKEKSNKFVRTKKRGWYTKEKMKIKLGWSKFLVWIKLNDSLIRCFDSMNLERYLIMNMTTCQPAGPTSMMWWNTARRKGTKPSESN